MHGLFVADLAWRPAYEHVEKVHAVLEKWNLANGRELYVSGEPVTEASIKRAMPDNLHAAYEGAEGAAVVAVMGESQYGLGEDTRYLQSVSVVLGVDIKVLRAESFDFAITKPAMEGKKKLELDDFYDEVGSHAVFRATWNTALPKLGTPKRHGVMDFSGMWRSGIVLDCGKDLPEIAEEQDRPLPATAFHADLEQAFGTKLVECGWIY
jgi:hypothetical protein